MPRDQEIKFQDQIRGWVSVNSNNVDDKVVYKSDQMPTYHLANVVDDYLMKISHVIRGEEWLPSAPLHVYLYQCFGWEDSMPTFAHLPLILKPDGNGKLSKRDGDRLGFPVFPIDWNNQESDEVFPGYREKGFMSEAFINMLAFLGWNPGTEQEIFSLSELVSEFSLERVGKSGSKYDYSKTKWFNQQHLRTQTDQAIFDNIIRTNSNLLTKFPKDYIINTIALVKERAVFESDIIKEGAPFFSDKIEFNAKAVSKKWKSDLVPNLIELSNNLFELDEFIATDIENSFHEYLSSANIGFGKIMPMLRIAITGNLAGPSMFDSLQLIGKNTMKERVDLAIQTLN